MAQKAFVFALKQIRSRSSTAISHKSLPVEKRVWQLNLENNINGKTSVGKEKDSSTSNFPFALNIKLILTFTTSMRKYIAPYTLTQNIPPFNN